MFKVSENFFVSGQIDSNSIPALKAESFKTIICNRPDNEEPVSYTHLRAHET